MRCGFCGDDTETVDVCDCCGRTPTGCYADVDKQCYCASCHDHRETMEREFAYLARVPSPSQYAQDMHDSGRGHLLSETERGMVRS